MLNLVHPEQGNTVLDFECGSGSFLRAVAAGIVPNHVTGIDIGDLPYYVTIVYLAIYQGSMGNGLKTDQSNSSKMDCYIQGHRPTS